MAILLTHHLVKALKEQERASLNVYLGDLYGSHVHRVRAPVTPGACYLDRVTAMCEDKPIHAEVPEGSDRHCTEAGDQVTCWMRNS